ncbi:MAG: hypothetical protein KDK41_04170 [Leptospiraceae bacterium]|nr:hypothetical protein [Leptospiraceae bacterium]
MSLQNVNGPNSFWNLSLAFPTFTTNSNNVLRVYNQLTMNGGTFSNAGVLHLHNEASSTTDTPLLLGGTTLANTGNIEFHFLKDALGKIQGGNYFTKNIIIKTSTGNTSTLQAPITAMGDLTIQGNSVGQIASFDTANSNITANSLSIGTIQSAAVNFGTSNLNIAGDVLISDAAANPDPTLLTSGGTWTIGGNFTNLSTASIDFSGSTVSFNGTGNQILTGTTTFNNLTLDGTATPARTVTFPVGGNTIVSGQFQAWGNAGGVLSLRSATPGNQSGIIANGTLGTFDRLDIQDQSLTGTAVSSPVNPSNSTNSGNNTGWFSPAAGATVYSYGSGLYSNGALWTSANCGAAALIRTLGVLAAVPAATNNVVICNGNNLSLTAPTTANSLVIEEGFISTNAANHPLTITTDLTIGDGSGAADSARLLANGAVIEVGGNVNINTVDGQFVRGTSTLRLTGAGVANLNIANTATTSDLNRLEITGGGTWNLGTNLTIFDDALSITNGNLNHSTFTIILESADFTQTGGAISSTTGQLILGGTGGTLSQTAGTFGSIMRHNTNAVWSLATDFTSTSGFIKDNSGTFDLNNFNLTLGGGFQMNFGEIRQRSGNFVTNGSFLQNGGTFRADTGNTSIFGNYTYSAGTFQADTGIVTFTGTGAGGQISSGSTTFNNITINGTGGTYTLQDAMNLSGNLTIEQGILDTGANQTITVAGNVTISTGLGAVDSAVFNANAATINVGGSWDRHATNGRYNYTVPNIVNFTGTGSINNMVNFGGPTTNSFDNLTVAAAGQTTTINSDIMVYNQTNMGSGTITSAGSTLWAACSVGAGCSSTTTVVPSGTTFAGTGTIVFGYDAASDNVIVGQNYGNWNFEVQLNGIPSGNVAAVILNGPLTTSGYMTIRGGTNANSRAIFKTGNFDLSIGGNLTLGLGTVQPGSLIAGTSNINVDGNLNILNDTPNSQITTTGGTWNVAGNIDVNEAPADINLTGSTFILDGTADQSISGTQSIAFNNLTLQTAAGGKTISFQDGNTYTVGGTLTAAGSAGNLLTLNSITPGNQSTITVNGAALVAANYSYLRIQDHVLNGSAWSAHIDPANSTNLGNTIGWFPATLLYTRVTGNWTNGNTWSELGCGLAAYGSPPPAGMDVQICNGHTITVDAATATIDDLTHTAGGTLTVDNPLNINGNLNIGGTSTTNGTNSINITGAGTSTLIATAPLANTNIDVNIADGTRTLAGNFATGNAFNVLAGTLDTSVTNYTLQAGSYSFTTGTLNANASSIITNGSFQNFGATLNMGTSTLELRGTPNGVANNYNLQTNASTLANILLDNVGEATTNFDTFTLSDALSITGNLTIRDNTFDTNSANDYAVNIVGNLAIGDSTPAPNTAVFNANSSNVTVSGNWDRDANDGTFNRDNGQIVNLTGTGNVSGMTAIGGTANNFYTLSAASAGQTITHPGTDPLVVMNQLILNGGTFAENSAAQPFNGAVLPNKTFLVKDASSVAPSVLSATANSTITGNNFTVLCNSTPCSIPGNTSGANTIAWNNTSLSLDVSNGATIQLLNPITIAGNVMIFSSTAPIGTFDINGNAVNAVNLRIGWDEAAQPTWDANLINTGASANVTLSSNMNIEPGSQLNNTNMPLTLTGILTNTGSIDLNQNITAANIFNPATMNVNTNATIVTGAGSLLVNNAASTLNIADGVTLTMDGNLSHSDGAITLGGGTSGTLDLKRNFTKSGGTITINAGSTLSATGISNQSIDVTGGLALQNFTLNNTSGALRTVAFTAGETFSVAGDFNAAGGGSAASRLALASLTPGTQLNLNINGTFNAANDWLQVSDVDATGSGVATPLFASLGNNSNGGNSPGWFPLTILYSRLTGNWTAPATWSDVACSGATAGGPLPTATVDVEICTGHTVTVNSAGTTAQDMLISGGTLDRQDFAPAVRNFAITGGNVTVSGAIHWMPVSGNMVLTAGNAGFRYRPDSPTGTISQTSAIIGAIEFRGNYTLTTDLTLGALYTATGGTVNLDGFDLVATGAGATQNATDNVNVGTGNLTLNGPFTMNGGTITATTGNINVADLNLNAGSNVNLGSGTFSISGDLTNAGTINPGTALVQLTSAGANRTITTGPVTLDRVNVATTGGFAAILGNNLSILNDLTVSSGELQTGTFNLNVGGNVVQTGGVLTVSDATTLAADGLNKSAGTLNLGPTGNSILTINSNWSHTGGTIVAAAGDTINGAITNATRGFYRPTFAVGDLIPNNPAAFGYYFDPTGTADAVRIQITEPNRNLDAGLAESFNVTLETNAGTTDTLVVTMNETSMNSGIFQSAAIVGRIIGVAPGAIPAEIEAVIGDVLRFTDTDPFNPADTLLVETQVTDATAAAIATRTTRDTDGDGRVDRLEFTFATPVNRGCGDVVVSITDYPGPMNFGDCTGTGTTFHINLDQTVFNCSGPTADLCTNNTGWVPNIQFTAGAMLIADGAPLPATDGAAPVAIATKPKVGQSVAEIIFSEPVQRIGGGSVTLSDVGYTNISGNGVSLISGLSQNSSRISLSLNTLFSATDNEQDRVSGAAGVLEDAAGNALPAYDLPMRDPDFQLTIAGDSGRISDNYIDFRKRTTATVAVNISQGGEVKIDLLDMRGRRLQTIHQNSYSSGTHLIEWNVASTNVGAGLYFLYIQGPGWSKPKIEKLMIVR